MALCSLRLKKDPKPIKEPGTSEPWPFPFAVAVNTEHSFPTWLPLLSIFAQVSHPTCDPRVLRGPADRPFTPSGPQLRSAFYLPVGPGVAPPVSGVDLVAAETAQLDPVKKGQSPLGCTPQKRSIPRCSVPGWRRIGMQGARLLHGDSCRPAGGKMAKRKKGSWENTL